jgi:hypothetical protein
MGALGPFAPGLAGGLIMSWVVIFAWRRLIAHPDAPLSETPPMQPGV